MTATNGVFRLVPEMDARAAIMSEIAHEWMHICGPSATLVELANRWRLDHSTCAQLLAELADRGVLTRRTDGRYSYAAAEWRGGDVSALGGMGTGHASGLRV